MKKTVQPVKRIRIVKLRTYISLGFVLILLPLALLSLFKPTGTQATWMDDSWAYRKLIPVTAHTGAETNKYFTVTVDTSDTTRFQADCGDMRFTTASGKVLPYYIASGCSSASTVTHVLVPDFPAGAQDFYLYYGNPSAVDGFSSSDFTAGSNITVGSVGSEEKGTTPVAYWAMNEGTDNTCTGGTNDICDSSPNRVNGAQSNSPTWQTEDKCVSGKCLYFDGTSTIETVTNTNVIDLDASSGLSAGFTFEAWVRTNGAGEGTGGQIFFKGTNTWLKVTNLSSGLLDVSASLDLATTDATVTASAKVTDNRWAHIALSYTDDADDEITVWVNGISVGSSTNGVGSLAADTNNLVIGGTTTNNFAGYIDEFKIYNYEKSATQMLKTFNALGSADAVSTSLGALTQKNLSDGLVGYWKMNETSWTNNCSTASVLDSSGNSNNGKACPNTTGPTGANAAKFGNGGLFDGSDDYVDVADATNLNPGTSDFSVAFWTNPSTVTTGASFFGKGFAGNGPGYGMRISGTSPTFWTADGTNVTEITHQQTLSTGTWYHMVAVRKSGVMSLYVNGTVGTSTGDAAYNLTTNGGQPTLNFGARSGGGAARYNGYLDEMRMYNRALSDQEVKSLYTWAPGPTGYWNFDEKTGTTVTDKSGGGISATITDAGTAVGSWTPGKYGSAYNLKGGDGADVDKINFGGSSVSLGTINTVSFWVNFNNISSNGATVATSDQITCGTLCGYMAYFDNAGSLYSRPETGSAVSVSTGTLTMGRWYHFAVVRNGTSITFYMNGAKVGATQTLGANNAFTLYSLTNYKAAGANDFPVDGNLDEIKVYNYDRTPQQIIEDMNGGHPTGGSPVGSYVSYWKMDESNSTTAHDYNALNANDLTLSTSSWDLSGKTNTAWKGVGTNWLSRADDDDFDFAASDNFSISMWFKSTSGTNPASTEYLLAKGRGSPPGYALYINTSGFLCLSVDDDVTWTPDDSACTTTDVYDATWHHVIAEKTGTTEIRLYVDTKSVAADTSLAATATLANSGILHIGDDDGDSTNAFNGDIDEVKIYRAALTTDQINMDYNGGAAINFGSTTSVESSQLTDGTGSAPIGDWLFDEKTGTSVADVSGNGRTATLNANFNYDDNSGWTAGKNGSAVHYDGTNDVVQVASSAFSLIGSGNFTVEAWVYLDSISASVNSRILTYKQDTTNGYHLALVSSGSGTCASRFIFEVDDASTYHSSGCSTSNSAAVVNRWYHLVGTYNGTTDTATLYINGQAQVAGSTQSLGLGVTTTLTWASQSTAGTNLLDGIIDETRVYDYARSQAQISYDYNRGGPVSYWKFDECSGTTANDSSGNGYSATISVGGTGTQTSVGTCNTSSTAWANGTTGKFNSAFSFDGTDDYMEKTSATNIPLGATPRTISAWVKTDGSIAYEYVVSYGDRTTGNWTGLAIDSTGKLYLDTWANDTAGTAVTTVIDNTWHLITAAYDGTTNVDFYFDGKFLERDTIASPANTTGTTIRIGNSSENLYYFKGLIDDLRIYNYALSASQIKKLYNGGGNVNFGPSTGQP